MSATAMTVSGGNGQQAVTIFGDQGVITRRNSNGSVMGKRISFVQDYAAGDVRKALKETGLKGKALTSAVDEVLRGDSTMGWAMFEATISAARSKGFVPVVSDLNKSGTKLTAKLERPTVVISKPAVRRLIEQQITDEELMEILSQREAAKAKAPAIEA